MRMEIKTYWNERASSDKKNATTDDIHLRALERATLIDQLRQLGCTSKSKVADLGCGDGRTVFAVAEAFGCEAHGMDYSSSMIDLANEHLQENPNSKVSFRVGDIREVASTYAGQKFDFLLTDRVLINLEKTAEQLATMDAIASLLIPGGYYLCIENFVEGNDRLNSLRETFGLPPIAIRWHNLFFKETEFNTQAQKSFASVERIDFSSAYYLATRVVYSKMCAVENLKIDYGHPIHEESAKLPFCGNFSPIILHVLGK